MPTTLPTNPTIPVPSTWVFLLSTVVILTALAITSWVITRERRLTTQQYRLVLMLCCFGLSSVSALLFVAKVEIHGSVGLFAFSVAGPAVLWLAAIFILNHIWPEATMLREPTRETELPPPGWMKYSDWKHQHGTISYLFGGELEEQGVKEVLVQAYIKGVTKRRLTRPKIDTVFVVHGSPARMVKFQRITGVPETPTTDVYHIATPTLSAEDVQSFLFARRGNRILAAMQAGKGKDRWCEISEDPIDCLIVSIYECGIPPEGDYFWIDVPKFAATAADVRISVIAGREFATDGQEESRLWEVMPSWGAPGPITNESLELSFRECSSGRVRPRISPGSSNADLGDFADWLGLLDSLLVAEHPAKSPFEAAKRFLSRVRDALKANPSSGLTTLTEILSSPALGQSVVVAFNRMRNPLIFTYQWAVEGDGTVRGR